MDSTLSFPVITFIWLYTMSEQQFFETITKVTACDFLNGLQLTRHSLLQTLPSPSGVSILPSSSRLRRV